MKKILLSSGSCKNNNNKIRQKLKLGFKKFRRNKILLAGRSFSVVFFFCYFLCQNIAFLFLFSIPFLQVSQREGFISFNCEIDFLSLFRSGCQSLTILYCVRWVSVEQFVLTFLL